MDALALRTSPEIIEGELVTELLGSEPAPFSASPPLLRLPDRAATTDLVGLWLARRSPQTVRSYGADIRAFFGSFSEYDETRHDLNVVALEFCRWPRGAKVQKLLAYKALMQEAGRAEATVNRHLSAIRSLLSLAYRLELSDCDGRGLIEGEKVTPYRDTRGLDAKLVTKLLALPMKLHGEGTLRALRDEVILRLLAENGLRRASVIRLDVRDFVVYNRQLWILEKGKGSQKRDVTISHAAVKAIHQYLSHDDYVTERHAQRPDDPLVRSLDRNPDFNGTRLTDNGLWRLVAEYGRALGVPRLTPHMMRHTLVTTMLNMGYKPRDIQQVTGHAKIETLYIYADRHENKQGELTDAISDLFAEKPRKKRVPK